MAIVNGQPVDAPFSNAAWISKNTDDTATGKTSWANVDPLSGPTVANIQKEINSINAFTGHPLGTAQAATPTWTNAQIGASIDTLKARLEAISIAFAGLIGTGHSHNGVNSQGPNIAASNISPVPFEGFVINGTNITGAIGGSTDVSTLLAGKVNSSGTSSLGVVVTSSYNRVSLRHTDGTEVLDGSGNQVYGRLTYAASVWTLTYFSLVSNVETAFSIGSATDLIWYYQELFNPLSGLAPVYSEFATTPSDNATSDILPATTTNQGKVQLSTSPGGAVTPIASAGTPNATVANADHTHSGVHNMGIYGVAGTPILGDTQLEGGTAVTLDYNAGRIRINSSAATSTQETPSGTVDGTNVTFTLANTPTSAQAVLVYLNGLFQTFTTDFSISGATITMTVAPVIGQTVRVAYLR